MPGSSNFQQWNPNQTNQESDSDYTSDSLRANGAANPSIFPSATANKLFYQVTTFVTALAQSFANKGYALSDASLTNLEGVMAAVMTQADMAPYAPLASPAFSGTPTAPTPTGGNNSTDLATTAFVNAAITAGGIYSALFDSLALSTTLTVYGLSNLGGGAITITPSLSDSSTTIPNTSWVQTLLNNAFVGSLSGGYQKIWGGIVLQWGSYSAPLNATTTFNFPIAFPTGCVALVATKGTAINSGNAGYLGTAAISASQFQATNTTSGSGSQQFSWIAIGY